MSSQNSINWHTFRDRIDAHALISIIPIHRSQRISVVGASSDGLAIPIAKYVYDGSLIALDRDSDVLKELDSEISRLHLTNIESSHFSGSDLGLSDGSSDGVVLADALHSVSGPKKLLTNAARLVRDGGWMLLVDWMPTEDVLDDGPARSYRVDPDKAAQWLSDEKMFPITRRTLGVSRYVHVYRKRR